MITENVSTLKIHRLTQAQYDRELEAGNINENEIYLTPDSDDVDISELTQEEIDAICTFDGDIVDDTPIATSSSVGLVSAGNGLQIDEEGALSVVPFTDEEIESICEFDEGITEANVIPKATRHAFGCVKVGNGLAIDDNGRLYVTGDVVSIGGNGSGIGGSVPIGTILEYGAEEPPENWLLLNGQAVDRIAYSELFQLYGTAYGEGDGSTTFNLPDFRGKVPVGLDEADTGFNTLGKTGGEKTHKLTVDEMPKHLHSLNSVAVSRTTSGYGATRGANLDNKEDYTQNTTSVGGDQPHNNLQPYIVVNYIVKAKAEVADLTLTEEKELRELLWTNPDPTAEFAAQTINMDLSEYDGIYVVSYFATNWKTIGETIFCPLDDYVRIELIASSRYRDVIAFATGIAFGTGYINSGADNNQVIPYKIYGIKNKINVTTAVVTDKGQHTDLLWENASPATAFAAQTVELDLNRYDEVLIIGNYQTDITGRKIRTSCKIGASSELIRLSNSWNITFSGRQFTVEPTGVNFQSARICNIGSNSDSESTTVCIPYQIYGIKHNAATTSTIMGDYIIEEGTDGIWTYEKWNNGKIVCSGISTLENISPATEGSLYWTSHTVNFPTSLFIDTPIINLTVHGNWITGATLNNYTNNLKVCFYLWSATSVDRSTLKVNIHAIGRWK